MKPTTLAHVETRMQAMCGASVQDSLREAAIFALTENRRVRVTHNGTEYLVDPERLLQAIEELK